MTRDVHGRLGMGMRRLGALGRASALLVIVLLAAGCGSSTTPITGGTPTPVQDWQAKIAQVPFPKAGCFQASYPSLQWQGLACITPPDQTYAPASGDPDNGGPEIVGNGLTNDYTARETGGITSATGSFPIVTGVTSESETDKNGNQLANSDNAYSLQLNTNYWRTSDTTSRCAGHPSCESWQQFLYSNKSPSPPGNASPIPQGRVFMEYWLMYYDATCPSGWWPITQDSGKRTDCFTDSKAAPTPPQPITNLGNLRLIGTAHMGTANSNPYESVVLFIGGDAYGMIQDSLLNLASNWQNAEFNVFGDGGGTRANFNAAATIHVQTTVNSPAYSAPPICRRETYTGESNNLTLVDEPTLITQPSPALAFTESNNPGTAGSCAKASGVGDTHLQTFNGLFYDFQATGDFTLAQTSDFAVQTRQVSGAPTWPDAAVNQAVAAQMGNTRVALCVAPDRLVIDGTSTDLADGQTLSLPSGVDVFRAGNVYFVTDQSGNDMRAVLNGTWIDVSVGLGTWPTNVGGLLANVTGNVNELEASDGSVLNTPVSFVDLYGHYAQSWRVAQADSLLSDCGGQATEQAIPSNHFFASDLAPAIYNPARATCAQAGVKVAVLLGACALDVAVLGNKAATAYVDVPAPADVGELGQQPSS